MGSVQSGCVMHPDSRQDCTDSTVSKPLVLTDEDRKTITRRARHGLIRVLLAQASMALIAVLVSGLVGGTAAAVSALLGAAAYFVPNALFAVRLLLGTFGVARPSPFAFFWGEAFKLGGALAILALAIWQGGDRLVWPALVFGLFGVLKGYVLLLVFRKLP